MQTLLVHKRNLVNTSNQEEYIECSRARPDSCARASCRRLERGTHIRASVVDNREGPLSRSVVASTSGKLVSPHGMGSVAEGIKYDESGDRVVFSGLEERVRNVETHLGIVVAPVDKSLAERVKILEDKILKIEQFYPQIASHVFNYGRAEVEASSRPGGRVSKLPGLESSQSKAKRAREEPPPPEDRIEYESKASNPAEDSLYELKRRMLELKSRLMKTKPK